MHGAGLNRADLVQLAGIYAAPPGSPPDIPGLEFAGEVVAQGPGVTEPAIGARVFGIAGGGAQAELLAVPASQCAPVPERLDLVDRGRRARGVRHRARRHRHAVPRCRRARSCSCTRSGRASAPRPCSSAGRPAARWWAPPAPRRSSSSARALGLDHGVLAARELDPAALAAAITDGGRERRRGPRARRRRLPRDRPRRRRAARPHRARRDDGGHPHAARPRRALHEAHPRSTAPCSAAARSRRRPPPPTRSRATSCRCSRAVRCVPVIARTLPLDDGPARPTSCWRRRGVRQHRPRPHPMRAASRSGS